MSVSQRLTSILRATQALPWPIAYGLTVVITTGMLVLRMMSSGILPPGYPFLLFFIAILVSAAAFGRWSGLLATLLSAAMAAYFFLEPVGSLRVGRVEELTILLLYVVVGTIVTAVIEVMNHAVARARQSEHARSLLLREFRHRTRNDLNALVGLLRLRARSAPSAAAREGLQEAANYAFAMARVQSRLAPDEGPGHRDPTLVDTREFIAGLCNDIEQAHIGGGLRPVAVTAEAEAHRLSSDRAVSLGLVLNEAVTNALKYAFPEERAGTVRVLFRREGEEFVLIVRDDGLGLPEEGDVEDAPPAPPPGGSGLGTRLLRGLAAQLRGAFSRTAGEDGTGTVVTLRFPASAPGE